MEPGSARRPTPEALEEHTLAARHARRERGRGGLSAVVDAPVTGAAELLTPEEVLARYHEGPQTGVFTDGSCSPNPGPGGWGAVYVVEGTIVASDHGAAGDTTNNRMELQALIGGVDLVPAGTPATIYSDSQLVVKTMNEWAAGWARRGWKRKTGPIANLDLVKQAYRALQQRPELTVDWLAGHAGYRWNEYADALANTWRRER